MICFKIHREFQSKKYHPIDQLYIANQLDLLVDDFIIVGVEGKLNLFLSDYPSAIQLQPGEWDEQIQQKIIYPNRSGNGYERFIQS